jgi:hypothetical protein
MLESPPTIRLPLPEELPNNPEVFEKLKKRQDAKIIEGFVLKPNNSHDLPFEFYAEININNSRLWELFTSLTNLLPDTVNCIYNLYEDEALFSPGLNKIDILTFLETLKIELTQDCNLEFGIIYNTEEELEEIFVSDSKYLKVWSSKEVSFRKIMHEFCINEIPGLNFIDEFPKVVEPLTMHNSQARETQLVIAELNHYFNS